jgi:hypothetical protein
MANVKDVKNKVIDTLNDIDLSKLSIDDLQKYVNILGNVDLIAKEPDKTYLDTFGKLYDSFNTCCVSKPQTLNDLKGE